MYNRVKMYRNSIYFGFAAFKTLKNGCFGYLLNGGVKASITFFTSNNGQIIGHSNLLMEEAPNIRELPVIVRRAPDLGLSGIIPSDSKNQCSRYASPKNEEEQEMIDGFERCNSLGSLISLLQLVPQEEMTPRMAFHALKKILKLENNNEFKGFPVFDSDNNESGNYMTDVVINRLVDFIVASDQPKIVLETLKAVNKSLLPGEAVAYYKKLTDDILIRILENELSMNQILDSLKFLLNSENEENIDKIWSAIIERENEINEKNMIVLFSYLPYFNLSRGFLLKVLLTHMEEEWYKLDGSEVTEIIFILNEIQYFNSRLVECITKWLKINILELSEDVILNVVMGYKEFPYADEEFVKIIGRYLRRNRKRIRNPELIKSVMDYCSTHRIRSSVIFDRCSEYFVKRADSLSPNVVKSIVVPFGLLNFCPSNAGEFWTTLEKKISENFMQFCPNDILDIMIAYIYLGKFPDYLIKKIFHPYFLSRLRSYENVRQHVSQIKLKIIDMALTLEYDNYFGPKMNFPEVRVSQDPKIKALQSELVKTLAHAFESNVSIKCSVVMDKFPLNSLYTVDVFVNLNDNCPDLNYGINQLALLIHPHDHYDSSGKFLIGPQIMRKRHLSMCGLTAVDLKYGVLKKVLMKREELKKYIRNEVNNTCSYYYDEY